MAASRSAGLSPAAGGPGCRPVSPEASGSANETSRKPPRALIPIVQHIAQMPERKSQFGTGRHLVGVVCAVARVRAGPAAEAGRDTSSATAKPG